MLPGVGGYYCICDKAFSVSRGSSVKSDKCPQAMSLESASVGVEDYKFENEKKSGGVLTRPL